jgi:predicted ATPase
LLRQKHATRISLRRLAVGGVGRMLAAMSGQEPPPSLARVVFEEAEGNPFFVEEVFRHLSEEGKLFDDAGQWRPGLRVDQLQVPEGIRRCWDAGWIAWAATPGASSPPPS